MAQNTLWRDTSPPFPVTAALSGAAVADAVIVGGGFTGCSAALSLAEAGASVRLLEAETIGYGGSGRNVGLVNAGLWLPPEAVERRLGPSAGRRLNSALAAGPDLVFSLIERHQIGCRALRNGTLHCAHSPRGLRDLRERLRQQQARGAPVSLLSAEETARLTGARAFHGALLDCRAGTIQPLAYVRGLAGAAMRAGARIHERTPALAIAHKQGAWHVSAPHGEVRARALILATNAYMAHLPEPLRPAYTPVFYFQCATRPLQADLLRDVLPERHGCWDTANIMTSFRLDADGRLIVGAIGSLDGPGAAVHKAWARRKLASLFPRLEDISFSHCWAGRIAMTRDHLPRIAQIGPVGLSLYGFSGRGIAPGTVFGKAAADFIVSEDRDALPLAPVADRRRGFDWGRKVFYESAAIASHAVSARFRLSARARAKNSPAPRTDPLA